MSCHGRPGVSGGRPFCCRSPSSSTVHGSSGDQELRGHDESDARNLYRIFLELLRPTAGTATFRRHDTPVFVRSSVAPSEPLTGAVRTRQRGRVEVPQDSRRVLLVPDGMLQRSHLRQGLVDAGADPDLVDGPHFAVHFLFKRKAENREIEKQI